MIDSASFPALHLDYCDMTRRTATGFARKYLRFQIAIAVCAAFVAAPIVFQYGHAQSDRPILISQETSTRAIAVESITRKREPFAPSTEISWGNDNRTRVILFAMGIDGNAPAGDFTATAEDGAYRTYSLTVEYVGPTPGQEWITSIIVRLDDDLADVGDVLVGINYRGTASNRVRVGIGHVGDGPPDDPGAVPTPANISPPPPAAATAGTLTTT